MGKNDVGKRKKNSVSANKRRIAINASIYALSAVWFFLVIFFCVVLHPTSLKTENDGSYDYKYGSVMSDIDGITEANPRYIDIAMLASHDAHTSDLDAYSPVDYADKDGIMGKLAPITYGLQYRFGVTQSADIYSQLMQGSRFLHIKYTDYDGEWYTSHSHLAGKLEGKVREILRFLNECEKEGRGEIVGLLFQTMYFGDGNNYSAFHDFLAGIKEDGKNIYDYVRYGNADVFGSGDGGAKISELRYNDLTLDGAAPGVVLFDRRDEKLYKPWWDGGVDGYPYFFDMDANASHKWHSRSDRGILTSEIEKHYQALRADDSCRDKLRMNQTQAAFSGASAKDVFAAIGGWSLLKIAEKHNAALVEREDFMQWLEVMPVFQVDFVNSTYGNFNQKANALISKFNQDMVNRDIANKSIAESGL